MKNIYYEIRNSEKLILLLFNIMAYVNQKSAIIVESVRLVLTSDNSR